MVGMKYRLAAALIGILLVTSGGQAREATRELAEIRVAATLVSPQLASLQSPLMIALALRDQVYRAGLPPGSGVPPLTTADLDNWSEAYRLSHITRERSNACNGKSILYMLALRAFGIQSRMVAFYATEVAGIPVWSHASVDVLIDGRWIAMDPTFNVALKDGSGMYLSWTAAVMRVREGAPVIPHSDGKTLLRGYTLGDYSKTYGADLQVLSKFVLLGPWDKGDAESLNPDWDGKIRYIDGAVFDAWGSLNSDFYKRVAGRP
jgi:hypothetical protein